MGRESIIAKAKANRTRPAEIEGEPVQVRVHSGPELQKLLGQVKGGKDELVAAVLAAQFLDQEDKPVFTPEWLLSDECPTVFIVELAKTFIAVNTGTYKKK